MNCKNCGTPLMGMEHACPVCGAPLPTQPPAPAVNPMMAGQMAAMPQQMASQPPQMMPGGTPPMGMPLEEPAPEPKKGNNMFAILLLVVAFAAIGVGVFLALTDKEESPKPTPTPSEPSGGNETPTEQTSNAIDYAGYSFILPDGYSGTQSETNGLIIKGTDKMYTILLDATAGYDYYKQEFVKYFPDTQVTPLGEKEYATKAVADGESQALEYMTIAEASTTFAGLIIKSDYSLPTTEDLTDLNTILLSATKQYEVAAGDEEDAGRTEIVNYVNKFKKDEFVF